ncbi:hypothetical protein [Paenibacillus oleatilyticus]|uniref:hypothetical protein n=1 Tax=Paenibacillus oleatilyticus TaxID=2594886 RepID=UPI001C1FFC98|nr:hypothetical protein [Paenibacillus oleatilyticus]MBU7320956.1 hypothetical protein [Paenibacillus oleatilyticus]
MEKLWIFLAIIASPMIAFLFMYLFIGCFVEGKERRRVAVSILFSILVWVTLGCIIMSAG